MWVTLGPDESVVWRGKPSPYLVKYWIGVAAAVLLAGVVLLVWLLPADWSWLGWLVVAGGLGLGGYAYVAYRSVFYVLTTEKVYRKTGLVRTDVETVRLERVQNVSFSQSLLQRLVRCGDLTIVTAGSGTTGLVLRSVNHPSTVNGLVTDQLGGVTGATAGV